ncbi:MAG: FAD-binding oxidoreductase [Methylobacter sp.]
MSEKLIKESTFISFDGAVELCTRHQRPDRYRHLEMDFGSQARIARGGGYSFSAASFGENTLVQEMSNFDRFLNFDQSRKTVTVEAGMPLGKLMDWAMQRGMYFPVLPGYPEITVGGCVAVDAHGKNPWKDGTFSEWVAEINLFHPTHGYMRLSQHENPEIFGLTCGGFGMTGIILDVTLQLVELPSNAFEVKKIPVASLNEAMQKLAEYSDQSDFIYSWHDGTRRGKTFGAGIIFSGRWLKGNQTDIGVCLKNKTMTARSRAGIRFSLWNNATVIVANHVFMAMNKLRPIEIMDVNKATFPFAYNTLYHRFYGRKGFSEIQVLVGRQIAETFIQKLQDLIDQHNPPLVMISLKMFRGKQTSLSMSGEGYLVALNFKRNSRLPGFLNLLDQLAIETGAQPNLSKDSRVPAEVVFQTVPSYAGFKSRLQTFDPLRMYQSELSTRIGV